MSHEGHQPTELAMPTPAELYRLDPRGATGLNSFASQMLRNKGAEDLLTPAKLAESLARRDKVPFDQATPAFSSGLDLFTPAKPKVTAEPTTVRDNILPELAVPAILGVVDFFPEADTSTLVSDTTLTPHESGKKRREGKQTGRASAASGALLATLLAVGGTAVFAQDGSPTPGSFDPNASLVPSEEPITGAVDPCASPTPAPSESIIPDRTIPPDIGKIPGGEVLFAQRQNANGETVTLVAQQAVSPAPSIGELFPSLSPAPTDPLTGRVDCDPGKVSPYSIEALLNAHLGKITKTEIDAVIKRASKQTARHIRENGSKGYTAQEEQKFWKGIFNKWLSNPDAKDMGPLYAREVVLNLIGTRVFAASGDIKAAEANMDINEAFYRAGFSFLREDDGKLIDREKFDGWIEDISKQDWVKETEDELMHMK